MASNREVSTSDAYNGVGYAAQTDENIVANQFKELHGARANSGLQNEVEGTKHINLCYFM